MEELFDMSRLVPLRLTDNNGITICYPVNFVYIDIDDGAVTSESQYCRLSGKESFSGRCFELDQHFDRNESTVPITAISNTVLLNRTISNSNHRLDELRTEANACNVNWRRSELEVRRAHKLLELDQVSNILACSLYICQLMCRSLFPLTLGRADEAGGCSTEAVADGRRLRSAG